jgi:ribonuclease-3
MRLFRRRDPRFLETERRLGYRFADMTLLETALTHRSHSYERGKDRWSNYERLEFLGDSLLGFLAAEWLYADDQRANEGTLSRRRQAVVRTTTLARAAQRLALGDAVLLGTGEAATGGGEKRSLLADTFEAILGAVYLDGGVKPARAFVERHLRRDLEAVRSAEISDDDYKTRLQESIQARLQRTPRYRIVATSGPAHAREFEVEVLLDDEVLGTGRGTTRKRAEQQAARAALAGDGSNESDT